MSEKTIQTQSGAVTVGHKAPTEAVPESDVAYSSPYQEALAKEQAEIAAKGVIPTESFRGPDWSGLPNYVCPVCGFGTLEGDAAVIEHGNTMHPGVDLGLVKDEKTEEAEAEAKTEEKVSG